MLVDSNVLMEVPRQRKPDVVPRWVEVVTADEPLFSSPVSLAENRRRIRATERKSTDRMFSGMRCVPIEVEIASRAGDYRLPFTLAMQLLWETP